MFVCGHDSSCVILTGKKKHFQSIFPQRPLETETKQTNGTVCRSLDVQALWKSVLNFRHRYANHTEVINQSVTEIMQMNEERTTRGMKNLDVSKLVLAFSRVGCVCFQTVGLWLVRTCWGWWKHWVCGGMLLCGGSKGCFDAPTLPDDIFNQLWRPVNFLLAIYQVLLGLRHRCRLS